MSEKKCSLVRVPSSGELSAWKQRKLAKTADDYVAAIMKKGAKSKVSRSKKLEQYYTSPFFVIMILEFLRKHVDLNGHLLVEPSAGDGAISRRLPAGSLSFDVEPRAPDIIKADFLALKVDHDPELVAVIGNPPFREAVPFFNHAALQARVVALILPRKFMREFTRRQLNSGFHLVAQLEMPAGAFLCDGEHHDVAAVFQIWERRGVPRFIPEWKTTHPDFEFVETKAHFAIQRVGTAAGRVHHEFGRSGEAHLFVRARNGVRASYVEAIMKSLPLNRLAGITTSNPHITRSEIVDLYTKAVRRLSVRKRRLQRLAPAVLKLTSTAPRGERRWGYRASGPVGLAPK